MALPGKFDPKLHPRGRTGEFVDVLAKLAEKPRMGSGAGAGDDAVKRLQVRAIARGIDVGVPGVGKPALSAPGPVEKVTRQPPEKVTRQHPGGLPPVSQLKHLSDDEIKQLVDRIIPQRKPFKGEPWPESDPAFKDYPRRIAEEANKRARHRREYGPPERMGAGVSDNEKQRARLVSELTTLDDRQRARVGTTGGRGWNPNFLPIALGSVQDVVDPALARGDSMEDAFKEAFTPSREMHRVAKKLGLDLDVQQGRWVSKPKPGALEGPFTYRSGWKGYYDPKEGRYLGMDDVFMPRDFDPDEGTRSLMRGTDRMGAGAKKPYPGQGKFVVVQDIGGGKAVVVDGANTEDVAKAKAKKYPGNVSVHPNEPGSPGVSGTYTGRGERMGSGARTTAKDYLNEPMNYGGIETPRGEVIADLKKQGLSQGEIDRYLQGSEAGARARARMGSGAEQGGVGDLQRAPLSTLAAEIRRDWKNVNFAAKPYLDAMETLNDIGDAYGADSGSSIVAYFLSNATTWRGPRAKEIKAELKRRSKRPGSGMSRRSGYGLLTEAKSSSYPSLERKPGKQNWVDKAGGLPSYIERIAKHLHYEKGMSISHAIASAVNTVKRWCEGGSVSKTGGPSVSHVTAATKAKACKAVAQWEAKKARESTDTWAALAEFEQGGGYAFMRLAEAEEILEAVEGEEMEEQIREAAIAFDERLHPRNRLGEFARVLAKLSGRGGGVTRARGWGQHGISHQLRTAHELGADEGQMRELMSIGVVEAQMLPNGQTGYRRKPIDPALFAFPAFAGLHMDYGGPRRLHEAILEIALMLDYPEVVELQEARIERVVAEDAGVSDEIVRTRANELAWIEVVKEAGSMPVMREAVLSAGQRKKLPKSAFAIPPDRYPIHDESHARNALARAAGKPEEGQVRKAVCARYPSMGVCKERKNG